MSARENEPRPATPDDDAGIGELIRAAGPRPAIRAGDLEDIREAARDAWRRQVSAERRRRRRRAGAWALAASVLLALAGFWAWRATGTTAPIEIATVERVTGAVEAFAAGAAGPAAGLDVHGGEGLAAGTTLQTGGDASPGRVALALAHGRSVRLDRGTRARLVSGSRLELERGAVYVDSGPSAPEDSGLEVVTPLGVVTETGTQFEVRLDDGETVHVRVREGAVSVRADGRSHAAQRGQALTLGRDGTVARDAVDPDAPEWQWVLAAAPSLDIDGRTLESYLDWVARETGWTIRYADPSIEHSARSIRLRGTVEGLRPDESLGMVLQGSGLDFTAKDGTVTVVRP